VIDHLVPTCDPTVRAVFGEDVAPVAGNVIALVAVGLHQATGDPTPDALAAIVIGCLVGSVGWVLAMRNRDFLIGEPAPDELRRQLADVITGMPGIDAVGELLVTFAGPRHVSVTVRVDIEDPLTGAGVERLTRDVEGAVHEFSPYIGRVDVVASAL